MQSRLILKPPNFRQSDVSNFLNASSIVITCAQVEGSSRQKENLVQTSQLLENSEPKESKRNWRKLCKTKTHLTSVSFSNREFPQSTNFEKTDVDRGKQVGLKFSKQHPLIRWKPSPDNKLPGHKAILKPIRPYALTVFGLGDRHPTPAWKFFRDSERKLQGVSWFLRPANLRSDQRLRKSKQKKHFGDICGDCDRNETFSANSANKFCIFRFLPCPLPSALSA